MLAREQIQADAVCEIPAPLADAVATYSAAMEDLHAAGIIKTDFTKCGDDSLYVFASFLKSLKTAATTEDFPVYPRRRNADFLERVAKELARCGHLQASAYVMSRLPEASADQLEASSDREEHRRVFLKTTLTMCQGLIDELHRKCLVGFTPEEPGHCLPGQLKLCHALPEESLTIRLSHLAPKAMIEALAAQVRTLFGDPAGDSMMAMSNHLHHL